MSVRSIRNKYLSALLLAVLLTMGVAAAQSPVRISILPLTCSSIPDGLIGTFNAQFSALLQETGAFDIMSSEERDRILVEQAFQQTGAVDPGYAVTVGKLIGVTHLVTGSVSGTGSSEFAVSARLIEVETGRIITQFAEKRTGDTYRTCVRMLTNAAWSLAGSPTKDHKEYLRQQELSNADSREYDRLQGLYHRLTINGQINYSLDIFQNDNYEAIRRFFDTYAPLKTSTYPEKKLEIGGGLQYGMRLNRRFWLIVDGIYKNGAEYVRQAVLERTFDTSYVDGSDFIQLNGPMHTVSENGIEYAHTSVGVGVGYDLVSLPRMTVGINLVPTVGYMTYHSSSSDSTHAAIGMRTNGSSTGDLVSNDVWTYTTEMSGEMFGFHTGAYVDFMPRGSMFIHLGCDLSLMFAPSLEGTRKVTGFGEEDTPLTTGFVTTVDTSYRENVAMVKGDFLGSGEYYREEDPDDKYYDYNGNPVPVRKTYREFNDFRITLGVGFFF